MARNLVVMTKGWIDGSTWTLRTQFHDDDTGVKTTIFYTTAAGLTAERPLTSPRLSFDLVVGDADTEQDVVDALTLDDIKPGGGFETVFGNWIAIAEGHISVLSTGYTRDDFWAEWTKQNTSAIRSDARRALVTQRGWTVVAGSVHQHEGDGTTTEE